MLLVRRRKSAGPHFLRHRTLPLSISVIRQAHREETHSCWTRMWQNSPRHVGDTRGECRTEAADVGNKSDLSAGRLLAYLPVLSRRYTKVDTYPFSCRYAQRVWMYALWQTT
jgi:hypothetical protein